MMRTTAYSVAVLAAAMLGSTDAFQMPSGSVLALRGTPGKFDRAGMSARTFPLGVSMQATDQGQKAGLKVISQDWRLAGITLAGGAALTSKASIGLLFLALGTLFAVQTNRVRFVFDDEAFSVRTSTKDESGELGSTGENFAVGGENRWAYSTWVNYDFFPSKDFPILVYFKENQTPSDMWNTGPGQFDKVGGGQIHFFPALCNVAEIDEEFKARGLPSERYNPK